jgi:hypothetical protein
VIQNALQVTNLGHGDAAGLDREDDLLGVAGGVVVEVKTAVDAAIRAFLLLLRNPSARRSRRR